MKIAWFVNAKERGLIQDATVFTTWSLASIRYRVGLPAQALAQFNVSSIAFSLDDQHPLAQSQYAGVDVAVFSKLSLSPERFATISRANLEAAHQLKKNGIPLIADVCDNHFGVQDHRSAFLHELVGLSDLVVVNTRLMADIVRDKTGKTAVVIGDPCEGTRNSPWFSPGKPLRLLWFGRSMNFRYMSTVFPRLVELGKEIPIVCRLVIDPVRGLEEMIAQLNYSHRPALNVVLSPWESPETTWRAFEECDLVTIPSDPGDPRKAPASNNRLTESLWAGRFVVASPLDSYLEFSDTAWIGDDLVAGIRWALAHPQEVLARIAAAQERIAAKYSREAIARKWLEALQVATKRE